MLRSCRDKPRAPVSSEGAWHPGVRVALSSAGWLRTPCYLQLGFGANRVVQPWQAAPQAAAHSPGDVGLVEGWREGSVSLVLLLALFA